MAKKKSNKSFAEQEMEAYATSAPDIHEDRSEHILRIIRQHEKELDKATMKYLNENDLDLYSKYAEASAAFLNLKEDLRREGFAI